MSDPFKYRAEHGSQTLFGYEKLIRELDDKIKFIKSQNPEKNSVDSINLIKLKMMKKQVYAKRKKEIGGSIKDLFTRTIQSP